MNERGRKTLELPASGSRVAQEPSTREAHLRPSVVESYGRRAERTNERAANGSSGRRNEELAIEPAKLQALIRDLIIDGEFARQVEVSPSKTLKKVQYLSERDRKRLSGLDSELLSALAEAASKYARVVGVKDRLRPVGARSDPLGRLGGMNDLGRGPKDYGLGGLGLRPGGRGTGISLGGREVVIPGDDGGRGQGGTGRRSWGGLSRAQLGGLSLPGGTGDDLGSLGSGLGPGAAPPIDLGFLSGFDRPFGGDPLAIARVWHRLHPGGAASEDPKGRGDGGGDAGGDSGTAQPLPAGSGPGAGGRPPAPSAQLTDPKEVPKTLEKARSNAGVWTAVGTGAGAVGGGALGLWGGNVIGAPVIGMVVGGILGAAGGGTLGYKADTGHWWWEPPPPPKGTSGSMPTDEGGGPVGPSMNQFMPSDDGGPIGPWTRGTGTERGHSREMMPTPDGGPVGPWARSNRRAFSRGGIYMPAPDDGGGWGPWANLFMPNPEDPGPGTPTSRSVAAFWGLAHATARLQR